jgi:hypothetical protein
VTGQILARVWGESYTLVDPAQAVLSRDDFGYRTFRKRRIRSSVLDFHSDEHMRGTPIIFSDFQTSNELGSSVGSEHAQLVKIRGGMFIPINITCTLDENVKRLTSTDRLTKNKLINV